MMKCLLKYSVKFIFFFLLFVVTKSISQEICVEKIKCENNNDFFSSAYAIETDNKGKIFVATNNGVFYFNGNKLIKNIDSNNNYTDIINLYKQKNGKIWALPYYGKVYIINDDSSYELKFFGNENYKTFYAYSDDNGTIYFEIEFQNKPYIGILYNNGTYRTINVYKEDKNYIYYYLNAFIANKKENYSFSLKCNKNPTQQIRILNDSFLVIRNVIYKIKSNEIKLFFNGESKGLKKSTIIDFFINNNKGIYISTIGENAGLFYFNDFKKKISLYTSKGTNGVVKDNFGTIYFIDESNRLLKIKDIHFTKQQFELQNNHTISQIIDFINSDNIIIKDNIGQLYSYDLFKNKFNTPFNEFNLINKNNSLELNNNEIIFLDPTKLILRGNRNVYLPIISTAITKIDNKISNDTVHQNTNILFHENIIQTFLVNKNIYMFFKNYLFIYFSDSPHLEQINYFFKLNIIKLTNDKTFELYTDKGIYTLKTDSNILKESKNILSTKIKEELIDIVYNKKCIYYLSTQSLYVESSGTITKLFDFKKTISSIEYLNMISSNDYVYFIKPNNIEIYNRKTNRISTFNLPYLEQDELIINGFIKDDYLYFYSAYNLYSIPISFFESNSTTPKLELTSINYNYKKIKFNSSTISLQYSPKNNLLIEFYLLNTIYEDGDNIYYKLINKKNNSIEINNTIIKNREINISNINYGNYSLQLFYNNKLLKDLNIEYFPKWYQTIEFYIGLLLLGIILLSIIIYSISKYRFNRKKIELEKRNYQFKLESSAKLNQLKPHFIFNALTPIQNYILKSKNDDALEYLEKFSTLIRSMLNMSRDNVTSIANEISFIEHYLILKKNERSNNFEYVIESEFTKEDAHKTKIPTLLIQPIVENAVAYGNGFVKVHFINESEDLVRVIISDNGKGFTMEDALKNNKKINHALHILNERISIYKQESGLPTILKTYYKDDLFEVKICIPKIN